MIRLACLAVPLFPLAARLRAEPELATEAVALLEGNGSRARVVAATRRARQGGVRPGMTLPQARALLPGLLARGRDRECERAATEVLLEVAGRLSPRVEEGGEGLVWVDLAGLPALRRDGEGERQLGQAIAAEAERAGLPVRVGIAGSKLASRLAAALPRSPVVVRPGDEAGFLAPLPLVHLAPELDLARRLERWGLRSVGELAGLPPAEVASRLGEAGERLQRIARGLDPAPLVPREPPPELREGMELEWPLTTLEPFLFLARAALDRLGHRLSACGLGCLRLGLSLRLEPAGHDERVIALPAPTRDARTLLTLVRLDLEKRPPGAAVAAFAFTVWPDAPRPGQLSLFGPPELSPERLATTLARLFALLGPDRVGSPRPLDAHRPEGFALLPYAPPPAPLVPPPPPEARGLMAVRVLRPPVPLEVLTREDAGIGGPRPTELQSAAGEEAARRPRLAGAVRVAAGPWRLEEDWWTEARVEREYWDLELAGGVLCRVFREPRSGDWYADGIYD